MSILRQWRNAQCLEPCLSVKVLYRQHSTLSVERHNSYGRPTFDTQDVSAGLSQFADDRGALESAIKTRGLITSNALDQLPQYAFVSQTEEIKSLEATTNLDYDATPSTGDLAIELSTTTEAVSSSSTNRRYGVHLEREIKRTYGGVRDDVWRSRVLKEICETCSEDGGSDHDQEERAMAMLKDMRRTEKFVWEDLSFLRSILAAHNTRVDDAIQPDELVKSSYVQDHHYVFIAVDTEFRKDDICEVGFATLDTMDIIDHNPGPRGKGWFNLIKPYHFLLDHAAKERAAKAKPVHLNFNFGTTKIVAIDDISRHVRKMIKGWHEAGRRVVLVGQSVNTDLELLRINTGFNIASFPGVFALLDTYILTQSKNVGSSLNLLYHHFNEQKGVNFHNAGNDAVYCLQTMLMLAMTPQREWPRPNSNKVVLPARRGQDSNWSWSDVVSTQRIWDRRQPPDGHQVPADSTVAAKPESSDKFKTSGKYKMQEKNKLKAAARKQGWHWEHSGKQTLQSDPERHHSDNGGSFVDDLKNLFYEFTGYLRSFRRK